MQMLRQKEHKKNKKEEKKRPCIVNTSQQRFCMEESGSPANGNIHNPCRTKRVTSCSFLSETS